MFKQVRFLHTIDEAKAPELAGLILSHSFKTPRILDSKDKFDLLWLLPHCQGEKIEHIYLTMGLCTIVWSSTKLIQSLPQTVERHSNL